MSVSSFVRELVFDLAESFSADRTPVRRSVSVDRT